MCLELAHEFMENCLHLPSSKPFLTLPFQLCTLNSRLEIIKCPDFIRVAGRQLLEDMSQLLTLIPEELEFDAINHRRVEPQRSNRSVPMENEAYLALPPPEKYA